MVSGPKSDLRSLLHQDVETQTPAILIVRSETNVNCCLRNRAWH